MAVKKFKLSSKATELFDTAKLRLKLEEQDKFWTLRIALARSLQVRPTLEELENLQSAGNREKSSADLEMNVETFEQEHGVLFRALMNQYAKCKLSNDEYVKYLRMHIEYGLEIIVNETNSFATGYDYIIRIAQAGLQAIGYDTAETSRASQRLNGALTSSFEKIIPIRVGIDAISKEPFVINFNKTDEHANNYVGIVGKPGSGKTFFAKYFLKELREQSQYRTNFIIFDYAKGDIAADADFIAKTRAEVIDVNEEPIPLNIFSLPQQFSGDAEKIYSQSAERIVEVFKAVTNIGEVQVNNLYRAITGAYRRMQGSAPDFRIVAEELEQINPKPDSLTSVLRPLINQDLFAPQGTSTWSSPINQTVVLDIHNLSVSKDMCVFLVLTELYRQLMLLPDSSVDPSSQARDMRTVIVLDEAHHFLKDKRRVGILEKLIREIRSKGASVMLLSQSPDDYDRAEFDFLELLEFFYVLQSNSSSSKFLKQIFATSPEHSQHLLNDVANLTQGEAFTKAGSDKRPKKILLCQ